MDQHHVQYIPQSELPFCMEEYAPVIFDDFAIVSFTGQGWFSDNQPYVCLIPNTEASLEDFRARVGSLLTDQTGQLRAHCICTPGRGGWYTGWKDWCNSSQIYSITVSVCADSYLLTFHHSESFGNFEYADGYRECRYFLRISREYFKDPSHRQIDHYITSDVVVLQERDPH